jgi:hypothetical protein
MEPSPVEIPRAEHLARILKEQTCCSWVKFSVWSLVSGLWGLRRSPDFSYTGENPAFIYVDGPPHDYPDRQTRDAAQTAALTADGITVIRFHHASDWESVVSRYPSVFGRTVKGGTP